MNVKDQSCVFPFCVPCEMLNEVFPGDPTCVTDAGIGESLVEHLIPELLRDPEKLDGGLLAVGFLGMDDAGVC